MSGIRYGLRLIEENIDLVTFLNDGIRPEIDEHKYLVFQVDGPREISTKICSLEELNAHLHGDTLHELFS